MGLGAQTAQNLEKDEELRLKPQFSKTLANGLALPGPRMGLHTLGLTARRYKHTAGKGTASSGEGRVLSQLNEVRRELPDRKAEFTEGAPALEWSHCDQAEALGQHLDWRRRWDAKREAVRFAGECLGERWAPGTSSSGATSQLLPLQNRSPSVRRWSARNTDVRRTVKRLLMHRTDNNRRVLRPRTWRCHSHKHRNSARRYGHPKCH